MSRYINSVPQIIDANGDPIVGAKKVFYESGTTIKKTIYSDSGLSTPRTNPVTSDASGRFPEIHLDGLYDEVQQDNTGTVDTDDGATIWTRDNIGDVITGQFTLWINDTIYSVPEIVLGSNDEYYISLVDANQGNEPSASPSEWQFIPVKDMVGLTEPQVVSNKTLTEVKAIDGDSSSNLNIRAISGNLHLDSSVGASTVRLNFYYGTGGVDFGNGASGANANVTAAGVFNGAGFVGPLTGDVDGNLEGQADTVADGSVTEAKFTPITADTTYTFAASKPNKATVMDNSAYTQLDLASSHFVIQRAGTYRCQWEYKRDGSSPVFAKVYKNSVSFGVEKSTSSSGYVVETDDLTFAAGDIVELYQKNTSGQAGSYRNFKILAAIKPFG